MVHFGSSFFTVADQALPKGLAPAAGPTVVWLEGEHDIATAGALLRVLGRAIAANDAAIVVDLSEAVLVERVDARGHPQRKGLSSSAVTVADGTRPVGLHPADHRSLRLGRPPRPEHPRKRGGKPRRSGLLVGARR